MRYEVVKAAVAHAREIAVCLSPTSTLDCEALGGGDQSEKVLQKSDEAWAGLADGRVVCLFGVAPNDLLHLSADLWLITSADFAQHWRYFLRWNRPYIAELCQRYHKLGGCVYERHDISIKWLKWLGFTVAPETYVIGPRPDLLYRLFSMEPCNQ